MAGPKYRIKLYGHTSPDTVTFCQRLGTVLGTDAKGALEILDRVPVVIREDLEKDKAQAVLETLNLIKALAILEPMDSAGVAETPGLAGLGFLFPERGAETPAEEEWWRSRIGPLVAVGVGILVVILSVLLVVSSFRTRPSPIRPGISSTGPPPQPPQPDPYEGRSIDQLDEIWIQLDQDNKQLGIRLKEQHQAVVKLQNRPGATSAEVTEMNREVSRLREQILRNSHEMRIIDRRIRMLERFTPSPSAVTEESPPPGFPAVTQSQQEIAVENPQGGSIPADNSAGEQLPAAAETGTEAGPTSLR